MGLLRTAIIGLASMMLSAGTALAGPLHDAAAAGDLALMEKLVNAGADVNERNASQETPLMAAALAGKAKAVDWLLIRRADPLLRNDRGMLALHAGAIGGDNEVITLLLGDAHISGGGMKTLDDAENKFGVTPLIVAAEENRGNLVASLATYGADLEKAERHGYTALTRAFYHGHDEVVTILLRMGAACQEIDPAWKVECEKRKTALGL